MMSLACSVDQLDLDRVAGVVVVATVGRGLVPNDVLEGGLAKRERVGVAVHREEGVTGAVPSGVGVSL